MENRDRKLIAHLRQNGRIRLTTLSRKIQMPVSTIFDKMKAYEGGLLERHTVLLNTAEMGYSTKAFALLKCHKDKKQALQERLCKEPHVNGLFRINNGWDFITECVFKDMKDMEEFFERLETEFKIGKKEVHYLIEDLRREAFFSDPELV